jgi:hypothetical protein
MGHVGAARRHWKAWNAACVNGDKNSCTEQSASCDQNGGEMQMVAIVLWRGARAVAVPFFEDGFLSPNSIALQHSHRKRVLSLALWVGEARIVLARLRGN